MTKKTIIDQEEAFKHFDELIKKNPDFLPLSLRSLDPIDNVRKGFIKKQKLWMESKHRNVDNTHICSINECKVNNNIIKDLSLLGGYFCKASGRFHICGHDKCYDTIETPDGIILCYISGKDIGTVMCDEYEFTETGNFIQKWATKPKKNKNMNKLAKVKMIKPNKRKICKTQPSLHDTINNIFNKIFFDKEKIDKFNENMFHSIYIKSQSKIIQHIKNNSLFYFSDILLIVSNISSLYSHLIKIDKKDPRLIYYKEIIICVQNLCYESPFGLNQKTLIDQSKFVYGMIYIIDSPSIFQGIDKDVNSIIFNEKWFVKALPSKNNLQNFFCNKKIYCNYITSGINFIQNCLSSYENGYQENKYFIEIKNFYSKIADIIMGL